MIKAMSLQEVQHLTGGLLKGADVTFDAVSIDTRTLQSGELFIAILGDRFNGNTFLKEAETKKAVAAISTEATELTLPVLQVENSRLALGKLGAANRNLSKARVIALTGSQGKTTVKEMTANILACCGDVLKTKGNLNNDLGVPLTLLQLEAKHQFAVIELGANAPGEIFYSSTLTMADVVHITNVAPTHLEGFGDLDGVARAKGEIWESLAADGVAVLNLDDAYGGQWMEKLNGKNFVSVSALGKNTADYRVSDLQFDQAMHSAFNILTPQGSIAIKLALPGQHNVANALAAVALSMQVGAGLDEVKEGLEAMQSVSGRMCALVGPEQSVLLDDSYNASPSSFRAAIDVLAAHQGVKIIAMGDMGELGAEAEEAHREIGLYALSKGIDCLFGLGELSAVAVNNFAGNGRHFIDLDSLVEHLLPMLNQDVKVLIKGSRSAGMDKLVQRLQQQVKQQGE